MSIEQYGELVKAKEMYKKGDSRAINAAIAIVAAYLARTDLSSSERSAAEQLKADMS
jgi:hypothetical protein